MLRKRTSFKPNLAKTGPTPHATPSTQAATSNNTPVVASVTTTTTALTPVAITTTTSPTTNEPAATPSVPLAAPTVPAVVSTPIPVPAPPVDDSTLQDVQRLTGLRNSAYKNVKLKDLLFFNPPPTKDQKRHKKNVRKRLHEEQMNEVEAEKEDSNKTIEAAGEELSLVPKVKLGPQGQLILDESSTVINRKNSIKAQDAIVEDNEEMISRTNYDSYRRKPTSTSQAKWSIEDTQKFYQALSILGTDFSMMESLLFSGHRSRTELHKKFKREERINKSKIDVALSKRISLNSEELDELKEVFDRG